jgi:glycine cleavage system P protein (glycine dehydrogenase) subunit 1
VSRLLVDLAEVGYLAGLDLGRWYPDLRDCFSLAVTEKRTRAEIDGLADAMRSALDQADVGHA